MKEVLSRLHQQMNANSTNVSLPYLNYSTRLWIFNTEYYVGAANPNFARFICFLSLTVFQNGKILSLIASLFKSLLTLLSVTGN